MIEQIEEVIEWLGEKIENSASSPANKRLFTSDDDVQQLNNEKSELFHSIVAKIFFTCQRARPDIEPTVAYLCIRVTLNDKKRIGAISLENMHTWIDAAYSVYNNMRSQTGGAISLGWGIIHDKSTIQKLNTKSSTQSEVVDFSDYLPHNIQIKIFLQSQGYCIKNNVLYQDNQSDIRMEENGRNSCAGNSRYIDIRYFFSKDRVDKKEISIKYYPTTKNLADFFTKPLQGNLFRFFRDILMGYVSIEEIIKDDIEMKERVGFSVENPILENTSINNLTI